MTDTSTASPAPTAGGEASAPYSSTIPGLLVSHHVQLRDGSGLADEVIRERGYRSVLGKHDLQRVGFGESQWAGPGLLIPTHGPDGRPGNFVYRPDRPKRRDGNAAKYVNPLGTGIGLDVPPRCRDELSDPTTPLVVTEGVKKGDALATHGFCAVVLHGVWGFKGRNADGGVTWLADWDLVAVNGRDVAICFDSDVMTKRQVRRALERLAEHVRRKGGSPRFVQLPGNPDGTKVGVDDYLVRHGSAALRRLLAEAGDEPARPQPAEISWEEPPYPLTRPLDLHAGQAFAVVSLSFKRTIHEQEKNGQLVPLDPPRVEWQTVLHVVVFDGRQRRLLGPLAAALGRPDDAREEALRDLGVVVAGELHPTEPSGWSRSGLRSFLSGVTPDPHDVFRRLVAVLEHFMDYSPVHGAGTVLPSRATAEMVALWLIGTYFVPAAQVVGYLLPTGPAGSGKTKQLTILGQSAYLGELITQASTTAALKHLAQSGATLCVDDVENIQDKTFDPDKRAIILAGNRRGVTVTIMELGPTKKWFPQRIPVFCPKAFSSIRGFDAVLGSRTIRIPLVRTASTKANREPGDLESWPHDRRQLVDDCWALAMLHLAEVESLYRETTPAELLGRELEPWRLILTMARLIDHRAGTGYYATMLRLALAKRGEAHESGELSDEVWVLKALVRQVLEQGETSLSASDIAAEVDSLAAEAGLEEPNEGERRISPAKIGRLLKALQVLRPGSRHHGARRRHTLDRDAVEARARAYGLLTDGSTTVADGTDGTVRDGWDGPFERAGDRLVPLSAEHYEEEWCDGLPPF